MERLWLRYVPFDGEGSVELPGSKSEANRLLAFASLLEDEFVVENVPEVDDVTVFIEAMRAAGVTTTLSNGNLYVPTSIRNSDIGCVRLHLGMAGTAARFWTALACFRPGETILTGDSRLCERPMAPLLEALRDAGADVTCLAQPDRFPIRIRGRSDFCPNEFRLSAGVSSQFLTALLLCAPALREGARIYYDRSRAVSQSYAEMTLRLLQELGVEWECLSWGYRLASRRPRNRGRVEADWSAASYPLAAALLAPMKLRLNGLHADSPQGDRVQCQLYLQWGLKIEFDSKGAAVWNDTGRLVRAFDRDCSDTPDLAPTWAALALFADGPCVLRGLHTLKFKETDRIAALKNELVKFGADVQADDASMRIVPGPFPERPPVVQTYGDHRMAMAFALAAFMPAGVIIENPAVVSKSFPRFWNEARKWGVVAQK
ncbi:MAG: 3-phosphoshikimate 1-carboxyvinyltransferase [Bacteroidia bacterium]|nr:3-phosphoshikimate 1-carboxyvinyltransferase [Bacteroidia bacterium]